MVRTIFINLLVVILFGAIPARANSIVVIVNKENPVNSLTVDEVRRYFLLDSKNWPSGSKIKPVNLHKTSKTKNYFLSKILKMNLNDYDHFWLSMKQKSGETEPKTVKSNKFVLKIVGKDAKAIGYLPEDYFNKLQATSKNKIKAVLIVK